MVDDSKQEGIASSVPDQGKGFASRRKVIQGLAATVPVILTITSGEALANASSLQCIGKPEDATPLDTIGVGVAEPDGLKWVRTDVIGPGNPGAVIGRKLVYVDSLGNEADSESGSPFTASCHMSFV